MKKILFLAVFLLICAKFSAQTASGSAADSAKVAKYCMSFEDYKEGNWIAIDTLKFIVRSDQQRKWSGGSDFEFDAFDRGINRILKNEAFAVWFYGTLYVNVANLRHAGAGWGTGYTYAFPFAGNTKILFTESYVSKTRNMLMGAVSGVGGVIGGVIGGAAAGFMSPTNLSKRVCYLVGSDDNNVECIDDSVVPGLLADYPDLLEDYEAGKSKKLRRSADFVMPLLKDAKLVDY